MIKVGRPRRRISRVKGVPRIRPGEQRRREVAMMMLVGMLERVFDFTWMVEDGLDG